MDYEKKIEIPFGAFDSELIRQEISIPKGFKATIEGDKIILTREESEDEKVRKALVEMVHDTTGDELWVDYNVHKEEVLAWLDKQGESYTKRDVDNAYIEGMASAKRELEKQGEQKPILDFKASDWYVSKVDGKIHNIYYSVDKVEPKFKVGDWAVYYRNDSSREVLQVYDIRDGRYYFTDNVHFSWSVKECDEKSHLWTIQDAKDGDVIACENGRIGIFKCLNDNLFSSYCFIDNEGWFCGDEGQMHMLDIIICGEIYPATKEQRDLLFSKMNEAGYVWDADKKELKKIEQKSAWSEEDDDDAWMNDIISKVENNLQLNKAEIDWLKSLKTKVQPKQKWNEEDEKRLSDAIFFVREYQIPTRDKRLLNAAKEAEEWLKSLKERVQPQTTWKPSDEQMADLWNMLCECRPADHQLLQDIYYGLKKLREDKL